MLVTPPNSIGKKTHHSYKNIKKKKVKNRVKTVPYEKNLRVKTNQLLLVKKNCILSPVPQCYTIYLWE